MKLNLVGKAANLAWGCEGMMWRAYEQLGHQVSFADLTDAAMSMLGAADLNIVLQGYGLRMVAINALRDRTQAPVVCHHAEVMSPDWPSTDPVVLVKADALSRNAAAYDLVVHNCHCCLSTVKALGAKRVAWCSSSAVDATVHRRLAVAKHWDVGVYGWGSPRRTQWVQDVMACLPAGVTCRWPSARDGQCYGERLVEFIARCRVVVNCHYSPTLNLETRIYESLGCGVPCVSEPVSMPEMFPAGKGVFYGDTPEALAAQIQAILSLDTAAYLDLADAGYQFTHAAYSYKARCAQFLETVAKELAL